MRRVLLISYDDLHLDLVEEVVLFILNHDLLWDRSLTAGTHGRRSGSSVIVVSHLPVFVGMVIREKEE